MTNERPLVLHVVGVSDGGAAEHVLGLCSGLRERGFDVEICAPAGSLANRAVRASIAVHRLPFRRGASPVHDTRTLVGFASIVRRLRPSLIHAHSAKAGFIGRLVARATSTPAVFTPHAWSFLAAKGPVDRRLWRGMERLVGRLGATTICVSEDERRVGAAERVLRGPWRVIANGVTVPNQPPPLPEDLGELIIGTVARLSRQKGIDVLLEAFDLLTADAPTASLTVVGSGPLEPELRAFAAGLGVAHRVAFLGGRPDARELLATFDVFVLASRWEGLSLALLEARAAGRPCVASDVGGAREVIDGGSDGLLVPPDDPRALAEAIRSLLADPARRAQMGRLAHARALSEFGLEPMIDKTAAVYRDLLYGQR